MTVSSEPIKQRPDWLSPEPWLEYVKHATCSDVERALHTASPSEFEFAALISPAADPHLEAMAQRAKRTTERHFGKTISLYAPLYLSNYCTGGCAYCGFAADRHEPRRRLSAREIKRELDALHEMGIRDLLLLTGERTPQADVDYIADVVELAAKQFPSVSVECFAMTQEEYKQLVNRGCVGVTLYQESYDPDIYRQNHRWGAKADYLARLDAPERALSAGMRKLGIGALLGLANPDYEAVSIYQHARHLQKRYWRSGVSISFPRICHEAGDFQAKHPVGDVWLLKLILAFRITLPDVPLVLSTRESKRFRDGIAGLGINRMSVASRTTVGGYSCETRNDQMSEQFSIDDDRGVEEFCKMLAEKNLEPVFKNWDASFR